MQAVASTRPLAAAAAAPRGAAPPAHPPPPPAPLGRRVAAGAAVLAASAAAAALPAAAAEVVASFPTSGLIFKDTVDVVVLEDPLVRGVQCYLTDYKRSLTERLRDDPFADPSAASLTCAAAGPAAVVDAAALGGAEGREIFSESKTGLNVFANKTLRVRRVYDPARRTLLYISYSTRLSGSDSDGVNSSRYRTSISAVPLAAPALTPAAE